MAKTVLVTGASSGIGLALCRQLACENGCTVFLCARSKERGEQAVNQASAGLPEGGGSVQLVVCDVSSTESVVAAAETVSAALGAAKLDAIVNNAGVGLATGAPQEEILNTNLYGPKRVCEAFAPLLAPTGARIVNVGSGSGPSYVRARPPKAQAFLCRTPDSWEQIEAWTKGEFGLKNTRDGYGLSKAMLTLYTMLYAKENPAVLCSCITPGFIDTKLTAGFGASKTPEQGTLAIRKCLFEPLEGSGYYYGSDGVRSPLHFMRNPGEPAYDGVPPY